ncbi:LOW QUALITY PROTEIN: regulator of telomere elongation helicase 1 [Dermatophagoides farinae]|uniref:LOW QUALITY PROTEIN: regulator of telomere elongation helicase 1 n=1 Tax=Dermatophagoides farinae TaxID=6954 RepID=UPI003F63A369
MDNEIEGITVIFPFKPYDIQIDYMRSVIKALNSRQNALLESPTGTGKTLSLLCSTLAWLENQKFKELDSQLIGNSAPKNIVFSDDLIISDDNEAKKKRKNGKKTWKQDNPLRIIYSSRTHSQLNQASNELKNCYYQFCPSVTIGSRDQLCINPDVMKLENITAKNQICRHKVKYDLCSYHHNYKRIVSDLSFCGSKIYDIEDLIAFGNEHKSCPYYMSKELADYNTALTFMPYNYILDPSIRKTLKLNIKNTIIIFDEGHNIERVCEDSMSTELKSEMLALFLRSFDIVLKSLKELNDGTYEGINDKELSDLDIHDVAKVKLIISNLEQELDHLVNKDKHKKDAHDTQEIFNILNEVNLTYENIKLVSNTCEKISAVVMSSTPGFMSNQSIAALGAVCSFLEIVQPFTQIEEGESMSSKKREFVKNYKLYTEIDRENGYQKTWLTHSVPNNWTVYLWCMSPSVAIQSLKREGIYNLIITSGTLAPLESFEMEMGIPFHVKLQNSHVILSDQLSIQVVAKDPNGNLLCGSYDKRNDIKFTSGLGLTILEFAKKVPKGIFIFFSSYSLINQCIDVWKSSMGFNLWASLSSVKKIFVEPRNKREFNPMIEQFKYACDETPEGAIFMGVSRGKLSEGMDLGDDYCRAVMIISLPYPAKYDPKVVLKEQYLNENKCRLSGSQWYMLQMKRALNQSVGRVIRHKNDYGMIVLCDSRFQSLREGFSRWIIPFFKRENASLTFPQRIQQIDSFFKRSTNVHRDIENKNSKPLRLPPLPQSESKIEQSNHQDDNEIQAIFNNLASDYTKIKDKFPAKPKIEQQNDKLSIFDSFGEKQIIPKRKQYLTGEYYNKKIRPVSEENDQHENKTDDDSSSKQKRSISDRTSAYFEKLPIETQMESNKESIKSIKLPNIFDLNCADIIDIKKTILKSEQNIQAFESIIKQIINQPSKCRQLCETLKVYGKKQNTVYLAMRLNFILADIRNEKRNFILKDFSIIIPEKERKLFLQTCNVKAI